MNWKVMVTILMVLGFLFVAGCLQEKNNAIDSENGIVGEASLSRIKSNTYLNISKINISASNASKRCTPELVELEKLINFYGSGQYQLTKSAEEICR